MVVQDPLTLFVADKEIMDFKGFCFYTEGRAGDRLKNLEVIQLNSAHRPIKYIHAKRAYIEHDSESENLLLALEDAKIVDRDSNDPTDLSKIKPGIKVGKTYITIPLDQLRRDPKKFRASILESSELKSRIKSSGEDALSLKEINTAKTEALQDAYLVFSSYNGNLLLRSLDKSCLLILGLYVKFFLAGI